MSEPLPPPSAYSCPNCDLAINESVAFCPRCGAAMAVKQAKGYGCLRALGAIVLALVALPVGAAGACFLIVSGGNDFSMLSYAIPLLLVAGILGWGAAKLLK